MSSCVIYEGRDVLLGAPLHPLALQAFTGGGHGRGWGGVGRSGGVYRPVLTVGPTPQRLFSFPPSLLFSLLSFLSLS